LPVPPNSFSVTPIFFLCKILWGLLGKWKGAKGPMGFSSLFHKGIVLLCVSVFFIPFFLVLLTLPPSILGFPPFPPGPFGVQRGVRVAPPPLHVSVFHAGFLSQHARVTRSHGLFGDHPVPGPCLDPFLFFWGALPTLPFFFRIPPSQPPGIFPSYQNSLPFFSSFMDV